MSQHNASPPLRNSHKSASTAEFSARRLENSAVLVKKSRLDEAAFLPPHQDSSLEVNNLETLFLLEFRRTKTAPTAPTIDGNGLAAWEQTSHGCLKGVRIHVDEKCA